MISQKTGTGMDKKNNNDHCITLQGYPLDRPLSQVFYQSTAVKGMALCTAAALGCAALATDGSNIAAELLKAFSEAAFATAAVTWWERFHLNRVFGTLSDYAIDIRPDRNAPPTTSRNYERALNARANALMGLKIFGLAGSTIGTADILSSAHNGKSAMLMAASQFIAVIGSACTATASTWRRFDKVIEGKHSIVPPPVDHIHGRSTANELSPVPITLRRH